MIYIHHILKIFIYLLIYLFIYLIIIFNNIFFYTIFNYKVCLLYGNIIIYINLKYCKNYNKIHVNIYEYAISFTLLYNSFVAKFSFYINFISISYLFYFIILYIIISLHIYLFYIILFYFD